MLSFIKSIKRPTRSKRKILDRIFALQMNIIINDMVIREDCDENAKLIAERDNLLALVQYPTDDFKRLNFNMRSHLYEDERNGMAIVELREIFPL